MATTDSSNGEIAEAFNRFPFATDPEYQAGLQSVFSNNTFNDKSNEEKENMLRLSRVFYFNKVTGNSITLDHALSFESSARSVTHEQRDGQVTGEEARILSFTELKELIEQGKTEGIPNTKDAPPSENAGQVRKKPWET